MTINERIVFSNILCPIDFTAGSDESLRYGIALAKAYNAKLLAVHCVEAHAAGDSEERRLIERRLDDAVRKHLRLPASEDFKWQSMVFNGDPKSVISIEAAERKIDLIVMRSRRRPYAAALLGSTAESICRTAPCPVMITHPREKDWAGITTSEIGLERVLVAYDFSGDSELALAYGLSLAQEYQAQIHVLHVLPSRQSRSASAQIAVAGSFAESGLQAAPSGLNASSRLKEAVPAETSLWCEVKQAVREGQPYREVLVYADEQDIDLICIGASGAGFGMRALFGSNADRVLRQSPCPVLIARPLKPAFSSLTAEKVYGLKED